MKFSKATIEECLRLSPEKITKVVFGDVCDNGESADVALLLGTAPETALERAEEAALLYLEGRVKYIVPSGGVEWDVNGEKKSEAYFMRDILLSRGVPEEAIIMENEATTTKENMIYGTLQINRHLKLKNVKSVCIVTSAIHLHRSIALAELLLPRSFKIVGVPARNSKITRENWFLDKIKTDAMLREGYLIKGLTEAGLMKDIEI